MYDKAMRLLTGKLRGGHLCALVDPCDARHRSLKRCASLWTIACSVQPVDEGVRAGEAFLRRVGRRKTRMGIAMLASTRGCVCVG